MIKVEVVENFTLKDYESLKNLVRAGKDERGKLFKGDTFECDEEMAKYLTGENALNKVVVKVIEVEPKKTAPKTTEPIKPVEVKKANKKKGKK